MNIDLESIITVAASSVVAAVATYCIGQKGIKDGYVNGFVAGGEDFYEDFRNAVKNHRRVLMDEIQNPSREGEGSFLSRLHERILKECYGEGTPLGDLYCKVYNTPFEKQAAK